MQSNLYESDFYAWTLEQAKWDYQRQKRSKSWRATIREQRRAVGKLIHQNPSLQPYLPQAIAEAYESGKDLVVRETPLDYSDLPDTCPYPLEKVLDSQFPYQ
ncbi:DUF29 domain-containing protein [Thermosynechococcus sichuanensis E542]|uniref:DUF29 domain-containing protein n=1 Tax=Thermosynechococcus sichuanensis E542 TaxID=2016101 RepID=A0A7D6ESF5_9CYAN|nr:DUF29 domain-containing protein [Thermosynechococcus vestitus]QLL29182.1 DUF29 domain-containing protein [Thermosynechococcus vestitus E542]